MTPIILMLPWGKLVMRLLVPWPALQDFYAMPSHGCLSYRFVQKFLTVQQDSKRRFFREAFLEEGGDLLLNILCPQLSRVIHRDEESTDLST